MSAQRTGTRLSLTLAACALLAACVVEPAKPPPAPAAPKVAIVPPASSPVTLTPIAPAATRNEPWTSLTASFALHDCVDFPLVDAKEAMYTRTPMRFEQLLKRTLPLMMYVQKQLQAAGLPGEFAMLPMLESSYDSRGPSRRGSPAGMWQLMPRTAHLQGITVNRHYDGSLDPVASTKAAIAMLTALGQRFGDWRLADMAYNAGPYALLGALRKHPDLGDSAIPNLPVSSTTRNHLAKLMALSCILREPERFHVTLPQPSAEDELEAVKVPAGTRLRSAASMARISESKLRALNPGYRGARVPADSPRTLLLPASAAQSLLTALTVETSESVAQVDSMESSAGPSNNVPLPKEPTPPPQGVIAATPSQVRPHRVRKGETLWSIAHRYHVSVSNLKRWNHLHDDTLRAGEELRVQG